jgi:transcription termination factor NusB
MNSIKNIKKALFLVAFFAQLNVYTAQEPKKESKQQAEQPADCLEVVKDYIKLSQFRIPDWDVCATHAEEFAEKTECSRAAEYIIELFTGVKNIRNDFENILKKILAKQSVSLSSDEYLGSFDNFLAKKGKIYTQELAKKLLTKSEKPEHLLFYVVEFGGAHVFIIEKMSDGKDTWWRIYQSWFIQHTLAQWLGIDTWEFTDLPVDEWYETYGKGKKLNEKEILKFIIETFESIVENTEEMIEGLAAALKVDIKKLSSEFVTATSFYIRMFNVAPSTCKSLEEKLAKEKKAEPKKAVRQKPPLSPKKTGVKE